MEMNNLTKGQVPYESNEIGDYILTVNGYKEIIDKSVMHYTGKGKQLKFAYIGKDQPLLLPDNYKLYTWNENKKDEWKAVKDLTVNDFCYVPMNYNEYSEVEFTYTKFVNQFKSKECHVVLDDIDWWWCVGYYLGDGWYQKRRKRNGKWQKSTRATLGCNPKQCDYITSRFSKFFKCNIQKDKRKIVFSDSCFYNFVKVLGDNALEKHLPYDFLKYPEHILKALVDGYLYADGHVEDNYISCNSISKELMNQIFLALLKLYNTLPIMNLVKTKDTTVIEGRVVNQRDYWTVRLNKQKNKDKTHFEIVNDSGFWIKIRNIEDVNIDDDLCHLKVDSCDSLTVNGIAVMD